MKKIKTDLEDINFTMSALAIFYPDGEVIAVEKIEGLMYHIEYLRLLARKDKRIKEMLKKLKWDYYLANSNLFTKEIIPIFLKDNCAVYANLTPNMVMPTDYATIVLPEDMSESLKKSFNLAKGKFESIKMLDIGVYNSEINDVESLLDDFVDEPNSEVLFDIINSNKDKIKHKRKDL